MMALRASSARAAVARPRPAARRAAVVVRAEAGQKFPTNWVRTDPLVFVLGFAGWTIPCNIGVSAFGGQSLFGAFTAEIGAQLAHFPTGPALTDKFWIYLFCYHIGLFITLAWAQIGVQARKQGYW
ncbi:hypothetical protein HYH03_014717 [Edaphochlamys debaryana]|uniref:Uncharacterized protein n=1 Tax=Edaphochlamys debaryana TaxID=47281 RepID=A0A835XMM0_9CHLO|nr:hypothetical protein HYH03_014717 [Edaphochlamys debaryana]|eukprot:KAG2486661.1 hypothetical protein HYH03_014717 [Edaphochlamys debaryana]